MQISHIDHIVLTVADIDATAAFYCSILGMQREQFGAGRIALKFGNQKINLHQAGREFEPKAQNPLPGSADICLITTGDLGQAMAHVREQGVEVIEGPVMRTGAVGHIRSFYIRDPDQNLIEIATY